LFRSGVSEQRRAAAGFTLIEVVVALAVVAVSLSAVGALVARTVRGIASIDQHLSLVETARAVEVALPDRAALVPGGTAGEMAGHRWRVDVLPFGSNRVDSPIPWVPQTVVIQVQAPGGPLLQINTVRLRKRPQQ
jgi:general secretion pathway protein I